MTTCLTLKCCSFDDTQGLARFDLRASTHSVVILCTHLSPHSQQRRRFCSCLETRFHPYFAFCCYAMSASPESGANPPDTDLSFSSTSQLESQANALDNNRCSHLREAMEDGPSRAQIVTKYKAVISWTVNRSQDVLHPAKRRKVCICSTCSACVSVKT